MAPRNLVLIGFMGSGKTAIGRRVAPRLGLRFVDIDDEVVAATRRSIVEIFRDSGEPEFRHLEREAVRRATTASGQLIAPGGGAVMDDASWRRMLDGNLVVRLDASPRALLRRIRNREEARGPDGSRPRDIRPLADVPADARRWPSAARRRVLALMRQREPRYAQAPVTIDTTGRSPEVVARALERVARNAGLGERAGA
ncbi:MAG: shikimate kinase [Chloroflexota bacterium]|nr:shikimate kinase [Chloroflexota bacterium]